MRPETTVCQPYGRTAEAVRPYMFPVEAVGEPVENLVHPGPHKRSGR